MRQLSLSEIFMLVSAVVSIGLPIILLIIFCVKYKTKFATVLLGAAAFILFVLVLESAAHSMILSRYPLRENPVAYIAYASLTAGFFEETARLISFLILKKKYGGIGTGLGYGVGHGGAEAIILVGLSMVSAIIFSFMLKSGNLDLNAYQGETLNQMNAMIETLNATEPIMFLIAGIERVFALCIQISLSVVVFYAVYAGKFWLYPFAIILHALADVPAAALQAGALSNAYLVEGIAGVSAIILIFIAKSIHNSSRDKLRA
jgi:uncharacterized membrane protein YhfC